MIKSNNTNFTIRADGIVSMSILNEDGSKANKLVSLDAFSQAVRSSDDSFELPLLPNGIRKWKQKGDYVVAAIEYPEQIIHNFNYKDEVFSIPAPRSVWLTLLSLNNRGAYRYKVHKTHIFSLTTPLLSDDQNMYMWPFTNYSTTFGPGICWGSEGSFATIKDDCTIRNISSLYSMYFNGIFNDHLRWDMDLPSDVPNNGDSSYVRYLKDKESFDVSLLRSENVTFNQAVDNLLSHSTRR